MAETNPEIMYNSYNFTLANHHSLYVSSTITSCIMYTLHNSYFRVAEESLSVNFGLFSV